MKPPLTDLPIRTAESGFYKGFTKDVTITAKILVGALIVWFVLKAVMGIRVSEEEEVNGLDISELGMEAYPEFAKG